MSSRGLLVRCRIAVTMEPCLRIGTVPKDRRKPGTFEASRIVRTRKDE